MNSAVIYARYSSQGQREESIEGQLRECRAFAERNGFTVIQEYTDSALTGRTDHRPGFQKMIRDAEKRQFSTVIVWKLDRFARNRYDAATYRARLKKSGVSIVSAREAIPDGAEGIIIESLMEGMAEYYSANLAENVRRGLFDNALQRKTIGGQMPLGYTRGPDGRYAIVEAEAAVVRRIFQEAAAGRSCTDIAHDLSAAGFRTKKGKPFALASVLRILANEKYTGMYRYGEIEDPDGIPAIISADLFRQAASVKKIRHRAPSGGSAVYLLSGKLFCGKCGHLMTGEYAISKTKARHYYYLCLGTKKHECDVKRIRRDWIEGIVKDQISLLLDSPGFLEQVVQLVLDGTDEDLADQQAALDQRLAELDDTRRKHENLLRAIEEGIITPGVRSRLSELEDQLDSLRADVEALRLEMHPITREDVEFSFSEMRRHRDQLDWQTLVDVFINRIYYYPDHLLILFNFSGDGSQVRIDVGSSNNDEHAQPFVNYSNPTLLWTGSICLYVPL